MSKIKVTWEGNMNFRGFDDENRNVLMDAAQAYGGLNIGIRPMELMLISLGGCAGIEIGNVLNKMRVKYEEFGVEVEAKRAETIPKVFTSITVKLVIKSEGLTSDKFEKALKLGSSYCSAANMLKKACPINYEYDLNGKVYQYEEKLDVASDAV